MITELTREDLLLDLILRKELVRDSKGRGNLGCSDCEMVRVQDPRKREQEKSHHSFGHRRADLGL